MRNKYGQSKQSVTIIMDPTARVMQSHERRMQCNMHVSVVTYTSSEILRHNHKPHSDSHDTF